MQTKTTENPPLSHFKLKCTISANGVREMNADDGQPMCAWIATFTNEHGQSENFDYFTGSGVGVKWPEKLSATHIGMFSERERAVFVTPPHSRSMSKDKTILCTIAHKLNFKAKWTPDPLEILWAIARDGDAIECTFEDWCSNLGYDDDSRKAENIYSACQHNALRLRKLIGAKNLCLLAELEM